MQSDVLSLPSNTAKPDLAFYGLLLSLVLALGLAIFSESIDPVLYKSLKLTLIFVFGLSHINVLIGLTFETFRRYSRFGISHTKKTLNHILSLALVSLPFISIFIPPLVVPSLILLAVSKYKSPDNMVPTLPFYKKDGFFEIINALSWSISAMYFIL